MKDEKLIELIKKLSAMTLENGASKTEALFAAEKISKLKEKYNISLEELKYSEFEAVGENVETGYIRVPMYLEFLIYHLSQAFNCRAIRPRKKGRKASFIVVGLPHDVAMCNHFYLYLSRVLINESRGVKNKNAFCKGMIVSIMEKLSPEKPKEDISEAQKGVIVHRGNAIQKYIDSKIGKVRKRTSYTRHNESDYNAGLKKGKSVSLNNPINGRGQAKIGM